MTWQISPFANDQFFSSNGVLAVGYKVYTYLAGTTTKESVAAAFDGLSFHTNPIVLNSIGMPPSPIYLDIDKAYKFVYATPTDTDPPASPLYTADNVTVKNLSLATSEWVAGTTPTYISATQFSVTGDQRTIYHVGRRVKLAASGSTVYGVISVTAFASVTTVTVLVDDGLTISASLSAVSYGLLSASGSAWPDGFNTGMKTTFTGIDARTNSISDPIEINSQTTGTPSAGIGTAILMRGESADEAPSDFGRIGFAASDVSAGSEDTYLSVWMRVAGSVLTECYRWAATGAFKAIFTHANTADRTYTLQNSSDTFVMRNTTDTLTNKTFDAQGTGNSLTNVSTSALKTATGSGATFDASADFTLNDYAFFPSCTSTAAGFVHDQTFSLYCHFNTGDPGNTTGRVRFQFGGTEQGAVGTLRWRYVTASDDPTIWVAYDPATGKIVATWASDDPTPEDEPGVVVRGCTSMKMTAHDLESFTELSVTASAAQDYITERQLKMQHQAYRALQLLAKDPAPSRWLLGNGHIDTAKGQIRMKTQQEKGQV